MRRKQFFGSTLAALTGLLVLSHSYNAQSQTAQPPIKIGMSMPSTGGLAAGGKSSLLGIEIWRDDVNARGGLLGRKVELVVYDDKSSAAESPAIYAKLLDVDKVDFIFAPYATVQTAPLVPMAKQRGLLLLGNFSFQVNSKVGHDMWFNNAPWGPADSWPRAFIDLGIKNSAKTMAFLVSDQEFAQNILKAAKEVVKEKNIQIVYEQTYPPGTVEFATMIRAIRAAKPDMVFVSSYPQETVGILRAVNEIGIGSEVKIFGGGLVGVQFASLGESLGSLLNGVVNYNSWLPEPSMQFPGTKEFFEKYGPRAVAAKVDPLGFYLAPYGYTLGQLLEAGVNATKSLEHKAIAKYLRESEHKTIVGNFRYSPDGEWAESQTLIAQYRNIADKNVEQFRQPGKQVIVHPERLRTGEVIVPYEKARAAK